MVENTPVILPGRSVPSEATAAMETMDDDERVFNFQVLTVFTILQFPELHIHLDKQVVHLCSLRR